MGGTDVVRQLRPGRRLPVRRRRRIGLHRHRRRVGEARAARTSPILLSALGRAGERAHRSRPGVVAWGRQGRRQRSNAPATGARLGPDGHRSAGGRRGLRRLWALARRSRGPSLPPSTADRADEDGGGSLAGFRNRSSGRCGRGGKRREGHQRVPAAHLPPSRVGSEARRPHARDSTRARRTTSSALTGYAAVKVVAYAARNLEEINAVNGGEDAEQGEALRDRCRTR